MKVYTLKDGTIETRDTPRGQANYEAVHKDIIKVTETTTLLRR